MAKLKLIKAGSVIHGYGAKPSITSQLVTPSFTFAPSAYRTFELVIPSANIDAGSIAMIQITGTNNPGLGRWFYVPGYFFARNVGPTFDTEITTFRKADGFHVQVNYFNPTAANQTPPQITINAKVLLFQPPW